jgi:hypothetical protein
MHTKDERKIIFAVVYRMLTNAIGGEKRSLNYIGLRGKLFTSA